MLSPSCYKQVWWRVSCPWWWRRLCLLLLLLLWAGDLKGVWSPCMWHTEQVCEIQSISGVWSARSLGQFDWISEWSSTSTVFRQHVNLPHNTFSLSSFCSFPASLVFPARNRPDWVCLPNTFNIKKSNPKTGVDTGAGWGDACHQ